MAIHERLARALDGARVRYNVVPHAEAFTAQDAAHAAHVSGRRFAKVLVLREGLRNYFLAVVPAHEHVDFGAIRRHTGRQAIGLADELEIQRLFPDCEAGAMPPFGELYHLPMYVDPCLASPGEIWFEAGTHHEALRMNWEDFRAAAGPFTGMFCMHSPKEVLVP